MDQIDAIQDLLEFPSVEGVARARLIFDGINLEESPHAGFLDEAISRAEEILGITELRARI